jgi:hypothetical protein
LLKVKFHTPRLRYMTHRAHTPRRRPLGSRVREACKQEMQPLRAAYH